MKKNLIAVLLFAGAATINCQQILLEGGQTISNFRFESSEGNTLENLNARTFTYLKIGYRSDILTENLFLSAVASYSGYGAKGSTRTVDNYFEWDLSYLGLNVGLDYAFYQAGDFKFYLKGDGSVEFLVRGTQTLNNQVYKLTGEEDFDSPIYMLRAGLGAQYKVSDKLSVFTQYSYGGGSPFKGGEEKLSFRTHNFGLGLLIDIFAQTTASNAIESDQMVILRQDLKETLKRINDLEKEAERVDELEKELAGRDKEMNALKDTLSRVLFDFSDKGLKVDLRDNKIYVTLENDMLFRSGSWELESGGKEAVDALAGVLAENPDVNILIEGHTDNEPFSGSGHIRNNWDLSTKRAAAIVEILMKNEKINPKNLTAAGRGEYAPVAGNDTEKGKAKNRRIEVIISPHLNEIFEILNN
jgi:flagellar motor protein MotB